MLPGNGIREIVGRMKPSCSKRTPHFQKRAAPLATAAYLVFFVGAVSLAATGCGAETCRQLIVRLAPSYQHKRVQFQRIASRLPAPGKVRQQWLPAALNPPLVIDERRMRFNADVVMDRQLIAPEAELDSDQDLWIHPHNVLFCLAWTGPNNPLDPKVMDKAAGGLIKRCDEALRYPYLIVLRIVEYRLPTVLWVEAFIIDLRSEQLIGAFPVTLRTDYTEADLGRGPWAENAHAAAHELFWTHANCDVLRILGSIPGVTIRTRHECE